jgi:hypothetical protein
MTRVIYLQSTDTGYGNQSALNAVKAKLKLVEPHNNGAHYLYHGDDGPIRELIALLGAPIEKEE